MNSTKFKLKPGYSMIELMFYILIVGILLAGAVAGLNTALKKGRKSATATSLRVISQAIDIYQGDTAQYPESLDDLIHKPEGVRNWDGPYIKPAKGDEVPLDGFGQEFHYERTPGKTPPYEFYSYGSNGQDAPEDEWIRAE